MGSEGTGKSHLVKVIYNAISRTLLYYCKDTEKPRVLLVGPTGLSAVNIGGPPFILLVKFLIIEELSMISSDLWQTFIEG